MRGASAPKAPPLDTPLVPSEFQGSPYPRVMWIFFIKMTRKGCKRDYLDARSHFVLSFGAIGDKSGGGGVVVGRRGLTDFNRIYFSMSIVGLNVSLWQVA